MPNRGIELARTTGIVALISLLFAWLGVYDTGTMSFLPRFGFWFATMMVGFGSSAIAFPIVRERFGHWPTPIKVLVIAAFVSLPVTIVLMWLGGSPWTAHVLSIQYVYVFVISLMMSGGSFVVDALNASNETSKDAGADPAGAFMARLPVKFRTAELYAVSAEDHYLRVHTSVGQELILMRLADAMRELEGAGGLQTHRSWWVAKGGVAEAKRADGKLTLVLKSGGQAAVSRTYAGAVKAAGLT